MKFSEMTYTRPDPAASKQRLSALTAELKAAKSYEEARKVFLSQQELMSHISDAREHPPLDRHARRILRRRGKILEQLQPRAGGIQSGVDGSDARKPVPRGL